jgi:hypothetical protein
MTRVVLIGSDSMSTQLLARLLIDKGIQVLDAQAFEQEERAKQMVFELTRYPDVELNIPSLHLLEPLHPAPPMRSLRQQSRYVQSAKQQSLRAKARR